MLQSTRPVARLGHESGFSEDGRTFYATSTAFKAISAIDVTNPKNPHSIWQGNINSHGMSLSADGNRGYLADTDGRADHPRHQRDPGAQVQPAGAGGQPAHLARGLDPAERDPVHRVAASPYLLETDEYTPGTAAAAVTATRSGAARIIDISDERRPKVVSNLRLQVNQPGRPRGRGG